MLPISSALLTQFDERLLEKAIPKLEQTPDILSRLTYQTSRPILIPMDSAVRINWDSSGIVRIFPARSFKGTKAISGVLRATIFPNFPSGAASTA